MSTIVKLCRQYWKLLSIFNLNIMLIINLHDLILYPENVSLIVRTLNFGKIGFWDTTYKRNAARREYTNLFDSLVFFPWTTSNKLTWLWKVLLGLSWWMDLRFPAISHTRRKFGWADSETPPMGSEDSNRGFFNLNHISLSAFIFYVIRTPYYSLTSLSNIC